MESVLGDVPEASVFVLEAARYMIGFGAYGLSIVIIEVLSKLHASHIWLRTAS